MSDRRPATENFQIPDDQLSTYVREPLGVLLELLNAGNASCQ